MRRHRAILNRIDTWTARQDHIAEAEDLEQIAETARRRIVSYLEARRNGESLPVLQPSTDSDCLDAADGARERLQQKLRETGDRLRRHMEPSV
jgi:hypothetical protein